METRLAEIHIAEARTRALRIFCTASTIIPEEFKPQVTDQTTVDLVEFAIHARRINELCDLQTKRFVGAGTSRYVTSGYPAPLETIYGNALNRLIHAQSYTMGYSVWEGGKVFLASENNVIASYVKIKTDNKKYGEACVSIFGISFCFLTEVIASIKANHPELQF